jgi:hypothetical protein
MEAMRMPKDMCAECGERYAIRACKECGDNYCTPCYKHAHSTGTRKKHTYTPLGPVDCGECENVLAERWCVTCDEAHCDGCWRKLHGRGKRRHHPFCKVWPGGRIGHEMMTIDGNVVADASYDPTFLQRRQDQEQAAQAAPALEYNYAYPEPEPEPEPYYSNQLEDGSATASWPDGGGGDGTYDAGAADAWQTAYDEEVRARPLDPKCLLLLDTHFPRCVTHSFVQGNVYYYNAVTGVSQYEDPASQDPNAQHMKSMLEQWAQAYDEEGASYWYNSTTGVSQYENPFETMSGKEAVEDAGYGEWNAGEGGGDEGAYQYDEAGGEAYAEGGEQ